MEILNKFSAKFGGWLSWLYDNLSYGMATMYDGLLDRVFRSVQWVSRKISSAQEGEDNDKTKV
jgi:hypothetical protein